MTTTELRSTTASNGQLLDIPLIELSSGELFATVEVTRTALGYTTQWWISNLEYGKAIAYLSIPVFGQSIAIASHRVELIKDDVFSFIKLASGGPSPIVGPAFSLAHAQIHLEKYFATLTTDDVVEQAADLYGFLDSGFKVFGPIKVISELLGEDSVRTVQDRVDRARERGLLNRPGKGAHWS